MFPFAAIASKPATLYGQSITVPAYQGNFDFEPSAALADGLVGGGTDVIGIGGGYYTGGGTITTTLYDNCGSGGSGPPAASPSLTLTDNADGLPLAGDYFAVDNGFDGGNTAADIISLVNPTTGDNVSGIAVLGPVPNDAKDRNQQYTVTDPGGLVANGVVAATLSIVYPADPEIVGTLSLTDTESDVRIWWYDQDRWVPASSLDLNNIKPGNYTVLIQGATAGADTVEATFTPNNGSADVSESDPVNVFSVGLTASNDQTVGATTEGFMQVDDGYGLGYTDGLGNPVADNVPGTTSGFFAGAEKLPASAATNDPLLLPATLTFSGPFPANETTWQISYNESDMAIWNANTGALIVSGQSYPLTQGTMQIPLLYQGLAAGASLDSINADLTVYGNTDSGDIMPAAAPPDGDKAPANRNAEAQNKVQLDELTLNVKTATGIDSKTGKLTTGDPLAQNRLTSSGAYVPVSGDTQLANTADFLPFTFTSNVAATYSITIPMNVAVFQDAAGTIPVNPKSVTPGTMYWIKGISEGAGTLTINDSNGVTASLKITTFTFTGPQDVPQFAEETYTASGMATGAKGWISAIDGNMNAMPNRIGDPSNPNSVTKNVAWLYGPDTGYAMYEAAPGFVWSYKVNVVGIEISDGLLLAGQMVIADPQMSTTGNVVLPVYAGGPGLQFGADVKLVGAGSTHITVGFTQQVNSFTAVGYYASGSQLIYTLPNGTTFPIRDQDTTIPLAPTPWYSANALVVGKDGPLDANDSPMVPFRTFNLAGVNSINSLTGFTYSMGFTLYIAAQTDQAPASITAEYYASWGFNFNYSVYVPFQAQQVTASPNWMSIEDLVRADKLLGPIMFDTNGPPFNSLPLQWR